MASGRFANPWFKLCLLEAVSFSHRRLYRAKIIPSLERSFKSSRCRRSPSATSGPSKGLTLRNYLALVRFDKPIGTQLLFWPTAWGTTLADPYAFKYLALFAVGSVIARSGGCIVNDFWDRRLDAKVERTKERPLASGAVTKNQALGLMVVHGLLGFGILTQLNANA